MIKNPVIPGFNPDPSIIRVEDDYYLATSTFTWTPGIRLYHSKDLVNWRLISHALTRPSQADLKRVPGGGGVWAPGLSYHNNRYYLVYTDVRSPVGSFNDCSNLMVSAPSIEGPWSEPVYLNSNGIDPALFHDEDGRTWLVNTIWKYNTNRNRKFTDMLLQELDTKTNRLIGKAVSIFSGTGLGATEGPRLYKRNGYYYLVVAEGGTYYRHGVTVARCRTIEGPYEVDPRGQMLTARNAFTHPLQKAGHASFVETQNGEWYMAYLCARPIQLEFGREMKRRCILGRETAIERMAWTDDDWPPPADGETLPALASPAPDLPSHPFPKEPARDDFDSDKLNLQFMSYRSYPSSDWMSLTERPGSLMIRGAESLNSMNEPHVIARIIDAFNVQVETCVEFNPQTEQQMAGLTAFYHEKCYYYLCLSYDETTSSNCLRILSCLEGRFLIEVEKPVDADRVFMRVVLNRDKLNFFYSLDENNWEAIGESFNATLLSDECGPGFTGAFIGMSAQDFDRHRQPAYFEYFEYKKM